MAKFIWDHIHLRSPDPEATAQWFERVFGAEVIRSVQAGKPRISTRLPDGAHTPKRVPRER